MLDMGYNQYECSLETAVKRTKTTQLMNLLLTELNSLLYFLLVGHTVVRQHDFTT